MPMAAAMVMPNSPNRRPTLPGMNEIGRNTAINTSVVASTATPPVPTPITCTAVSGIAIWPNCAPQTPNPDAVRYRARSARPALGRA